MVAVRPRMRALTNIRDFVREWGPKIDKIISSKGLQDVGEDIKQDIYLYIITPDSNPESPTFGKNGLEQYDPSRAAFSTYVYALVMMRVLNARTKRLRELGLMPYSHDSDAEHVEEARQARRRDKDEANSYDVTGQVSDLSRTDFILQVEKVIEALRRYPVRSSIFNADGECITRDLATLFKLILEEKTREEIVDYFKYSTGSVGVMFDQLRQVPEVQQLKEMLFGG